MSIGIHPDPDASWRETRAFLAEQVETSNRAAEAYFASHARTIARCAAAMADRFFAGGTLLVFGSGPHATDAQHNSVEFVHPVLAGCRALPALALTNDIATVTSMHQIDAAEVYAHQVRVLGRSGDIALALVHGQAHESITRGLAAAAAAGMLTVALTSGGGERARAEFVFHAECGDGDTAHELHLGTYHMLWELVHIVLNHRGIGAVR